MHYRTTGKLRQGKSLWLPKTIVIAIIAGLIGLTLVLHPTPASKPKPATKAAVTDAPPATATTASLKGHYLFNGTTAWTRGVEYYANRAGNFTQPFSQLDSFNRAAYDGWFVDLECPITNNVVPYQLQVSAFVFNCRPEYLPTANKYFNFYNLANNHTDNQDGMAGLSETREHLAASAGTQYFGNFDPSVAKDICEVAAMPVRLQKADKTETKATLPIALCAWHYFYRTPRPGEIEVMQRYAKIMPVFAMAHMGTEYKPAANAIQVDIAHRIIDQGPEFLIANNPHWVQNTEVYKDKLIVYSTANFLFDQLEAEGQQSASIDITMQVNYDANVAKWLALAPTCQTYQDDCLAQAEQQQLQKIKPRYTYAAVAGQGGSGKITHKADAAVQAAVEDRLNWTQTLNALGQK